MLSERGRPSFFVVCPALFDNNKGTGHIHSHGAAPAPNGIEFGLPE